ncbi:hypothetical protein HU200_006729 [Digitaria exilis]|uniref:Cytochrome P450 n=1 Tax=Digitaria exilis TaxID=1010633 RepID=A0A835FQG6_9POAL|nr:hypothetical protein HU200_006729 [Digitaria exilis]CAB3488634.1 unnamed protein product [Digitaria exilis]
MEAGGYLLFLPLLTCAVLLLLFIALKPSSKARGSGVLLPLPPSPPSMPVVGPLLWLLRARNRLEPAIRELHRLHGPVLALRFLSPRPAIFVSGRGATHRALVQHGATFASRPPAIAPFRVLNSGQSTVSSAPHGPLWRSLRRNLAAGVLSPSRVQRFAPARRRTMALLVSDIGRRSEEGGGEVDVLGCLQRAMFSLLTYMCFGQWLHGLHVGEIEAVQRELFASYISFQVFAFFPAVTKLVFRRRWRKVLSIRRRQEELFLPLIRARRDRDSSMPKPNNNGGDHGESLSYCYVDTLLAHQLPKSKEEGERMLTDGEMVSLCTEFLTASVDTTVTALQWIMANLVIQPDVQAKLLAEIKAVASATDEDDDGIIVAEEDLKSMLYLKAVVLEGLRRHPPAHFLLSHAATEKEASLDGYSIPAATPVNFSVADVSMDEAVWERPSEFRAERFMDGGEGVGVDLTASREMRMMPFGAGRRICPGLGLAMLHLECFVASLVREFEWRAVAGVGVDLAERPEFTVTMERPLRAWVARRRRDAVSI